MVIALAGRECSFMLSGRSPKRAPSPRDMPSDSLIIAAALLHVAVCRRPHTTINGVERRVKLERLDITAKLT